MNDIVRVQFIVQERILNTLDRHYTYMYIKRLYEAKHENTMDVNVHFCHVSRSENTNNRDKNLNR